MVKLLKNFNVLITTTETHANNTPPMVVGVQMSEHANIESGFLLFQNMNGSQAGINLAGVLAFSIEPQYEEDK